MFVQTWIVVRHVQNHVQKVRCAQPLWNIVKLTVVVVWTPCQIAKHRKLHSQHANARTEDVLKTWIVVKTLFVKWKQMSLEKQLGDALVTYNFIVCYETFAFAPDQDRPSKRFLPVWQFEIHVSANKDWETPKSFQRRELPKDETVFCFPLRTSDPNHKTNWRTRYVWNVHGWLCRLYQQWMFLYGDAECSRTDVDISPCSSRRKMFRKYETSSGRRKTYDDKIRYARTNYPTRSVPRRWHISRYIFKEQPPEWLSTYSFWRR